MATPWEQATEFVDTRYPLLRRLTRNARPTRPLDVLDVITTCWMNDVLDRIGCPAWVFIYKHGGGLYEWADNIAPADVGRGCMGYTKLLSVKSYGGMVFLAAWRDRRLEVPVVALVRSHRLFIFDRPDGFHPPLTKAGWERYCFV